MHDSPQQPGDGVPLRIEITCGSFHFRGTVRFAGRTNEARGTRAVDAGARGRHGRGRRPAPAVAAEGGTVSCKKGCAACCRYLVHVSESEAYYLYELVERLPEPRRSQVRERFAEARRRLQQAGFLETLQQFPMWTGPEIHQRGQAYHALQIP